MSFLLERQLKYGLLALILLEFCHFMRPLLYYVCLVGRQINYPNFLFSRMWLHNNDIARYCQKGTIHLDCQTHKFK